MSPPLNADPFELKRELSKIFMLEGEVGWAGHDVFNSNEYIQAVRARVQVCAALYSEATIICGHTVSEIERQRQRGFAGDIAQLPSKPTTQSFFVELDYPSVRLSFQFALVSIKSFLDALSKLLEEPLGKRIKGFNRKRGIVGGEVLRVLRNSTTATLLHKEELITLIEKHKGEWIDDVVNMRDNVIHNRNEIQDFINFWTIFEAGRNRPYDQNDIHEPALRNGERVDLFFQKILPLIRDFTFEFRDLVFPAEERKRNLDTQINDDKK